MRTVVIGDHPTQVFVDRVAVPLTPRERTLVAAVALFHPDGASADRLVDLVWDGRAPATARQSLHNHLSRVRRRVPGLIVGTDVGYTLADGVARSITSGVTGHLCPELPGTIVVERRRFEVVRGDVVTDGARDVRPGAASDRSVGVAALHAAVETDPYDERAWFHLIAALAAEHGRDAGLVAADRAARTLATCGLEPGRRLRDLERLVRDGERDLDRLTTDRSRRTRSPAEPSAAAALRRAGADEVVGLLDEDRAFHVQVHGPPRSGRSSLADLVAIRAHRLGAAVRTMYGCEFAGLPLPLPGSWHPRRRRILVVDDVDRLEAASRRSLDRLVAQSLAAEHSLLVVTTSRRPHRIAVLDGAPGVETRDAPTSRSPSSTSVDRAAVDLDRMPTVAVRVLHVVALSELPVHVDDLDAVVPGASAAQQTLLRSGLVRDRHGSGHWTIVDDEVRRTILDGLADDEVARLHLELAAAAFERDDETVRVRRLARHALGAAPLDARAAVAALEAAAEQARTSFDHPAAAAFFGRASAVCADVDPERSDRLLVAAGRSLLAGGDLDGLDVLEDVADRALAAAIPSVAAAAAHAFCRLGPSSSAGVVDARAAALTDRVLADLSAPVDVALVAGADTMVHVFGGDADRCRRRIRQALAAAEASGRDDVLAEVLPFAYLALAAPEDLEERETIASRLEDLAVRLDRQDVRWEAAHLRFSNQLQRGDPAFRDTAVELADAAGNSHEATRDWEMAYVRATVAHLDGRFDDAEAEITASLDIAGAVGATRAMAVYGAVVLACRMVEGRVHELAPTIEAIAAEQPAMSAWQAPLALAAATIGDVPTATAAFDRLVGDADGLVRDCTYTAAVAMLGEAAALLGDPRRIETAIRHLAPWSGRWAWTGTCVFGPVDLTLARLAEVQHDHHSALRAGVAALGSAATMRSPRLAEQAAALVLRVA